MRRIGAGERRARLGRRHLISAPAPARSPVTVGRALVALHSTDPASVFLTVAARKRWAATTVAVVERALYDERTLVRMHGMRRTLFVVPAELVPVVQAACSSAIAAREHRRLIGLVEAAGIAKDGRRWLRAAEAGALRALAARGRATAAELAEDEPRLRREIMLAPGTKWEARQRVAPRLLWILGAEGRIVRGRPLGTWTGGQYVWTLVERWLAGGIEVTPVEDAQAELLRWWLRGYGPGTAADMRWWTGLTAREVHRALARLEVAEVDVDGATGFVLEDDQERVGEPAPWVALLPAFDPSVMGWAGREWYLGPHGPRLFDVNGNPGPTVWCDGRVVGGWIQRRDGEIRLGLLEDVGREAEAAIDAQVERVAAWLGDVRVTPRFHTPMEFELSR